MIDLVYNTVLTIINKEIDGYLSPSEFNILANQVQTEIFRSYFEDENIDKNKENRGLTNDGYSNLAFKQAQRIEQFSDVANITAANNLFALPSNMYFIEDNGVSSTASANSYNAVISKVEQSEYNYLTRSSARPTELYPIYTQRGSNLQVFPTTITGVEVRYLRTPNTPNWTFIVLPSGDPMYNPADAAFQDFELHESEFPNIVNRMLTYFGVNIREQEIVQIAETLKNSMNIKDNG